MTELWDETPFKKYKLQENCNHYALVDSTRWSFLDIVCAPTPYLACIFFENTFNCEDCQYEQVSLAELRHKSFRGYVIYDVSNRQNDFDQYYDEKYPKILDEFNCVGLFKRIKYVTFARRNKKTKE